MKIKESDGTVVNIFGIYWVGEETLLFGMPRNLGGICVYDLAEVVIEDPNLSGHFTFFQNNGISGIYHAALIDEGLLDDLSELDETAYKRFLEIIKAEGLVDQDFY